MPTFGEIADSEQITDMERKHLAEALVALRRSGSRGAGAVSWRDMLTAVRVAAHRAERRSLKTFDEKDVREMEALDAAGNFITAALMHLDEIMPILRRNAKKWGREA